METILSSYLVLQRDSEVRPALLGIKAWHEYMGSRMGILRDISSGISLQTADEEARPGYCSTWKVIMTGWPVDAWGVATWEVWDLSWTGKARAEKQRLRYGTILGRPDTEKGRLSSWHQNYCSSMAAVKPQQDEFSNQHQVIRVRTGGRLGMDTDTGARGKGKAKIHRPGQKASQVRT